LLNQKLKEELKKRRVENGVPTNVNGVKQELKALIYNSGQHPLKQAAKFDQPKEVRLLDLEQEEERDKEIVNEYMRRHAKVWRYLFTRFSNQCYSSKGKQDFDDLGKKISQINHGEVNKMLIEHNAYPNLIKKDEIISLMR